ncbi:GntR family transcriptional regulator [Pseudomonas sp. RIT-PI-AD]|uniref:GntR family transcriptional regulator n=1 Tax=Pseudomonas sp. RIT-PI-AD TaxID=3035294 RepID=UPI0021DAEDC9|nr:GntR family transcriptional regulator [Pseudomonas sp. RIT-PI-AD]
MTFTAPDSLSEQIAQHLAERIIRGELKERERIQELKVTQSLNVSRGSVREALLILQRRHLIDILPRRGAQVAELTPHKVQSLYALVLELYGLLVRAVAQGWKRDADLDPLREIRRRLAQSLDRDDIEAFLTGAFTAMRATYPFANNPYLQETVENLLPAISRTYYLSLARRQGEMARFLATFDVLLEAVQARDVERAHHVLLAYGMGNCKLVLAALAER